MGTFFFYCLNFFYFYRYPNVTTLKFIIIILSLILVYLPGVIRSQDAPVTTAGRITDATPGNPAVPVPVTVTGFNDIGHFTLTLVFDTTRVRYVSATSHAALTGMTTTYFHPSGNTLGKLVFAWTGASNISLPDNTPIIDMIFSYVLGTGMLTWDYSYGSVCQYKSYIGEVLTLLNDSPEYQFYLNGGISNRTAPVTMAPVFSTPSPGPFPVVITVNGFTNIGALTLWMEYDPAVITYLNSYTKNPAFGSSFLVGDMAGFGTKRLIVIQWYGSVVSLANGATLCTLSFNYPSASCDACPLSWYDNGPSCEYADGSDVLIDMPQSTYYQDGYLPEALQYMWTGTTSSAWDDPSNWNACGIPDITRNVIIPDVSPLHFPVLTVTGSCKTLKIQSGATFTVGPTGTLEIGEEL